MFKRLKSRFSRFRREEEGTVVVEAIIMFPTLFAAVLATFVFFDAYRNQATNLKAAYTISDAISRETEMITNTYMINSWRLHKFLSNSSALTRLRVSVIQFQEDPGQDPDAANITATHTLVWSRQQGGAGEMTDAILAAMVEDDRVPVMPVNEVLIVVQTWVDYEPKFSVGLDAFSFENMIFTRPRFAPEQVCFSHNGTFSGRICPIGS